VQRAAATPEQRRAAPAPRLAPRTQGACHWPHPFAVVTRAPRACHSIGLQPRQVMHHTCSACKPQCAGSRLRKLCHKGSICHDDERRNSRAGDALAGQGQSGAPGGLRSSVAVCPMQAGACHHTKTAEWSAAASLHSSLYEFMSAARARQHSAHSGQGACAVPPDRLLGRLHTL